ncbi:MAG: hypothetical protein IPO40_09935 [Fibrobacteres bacterium]|nr:hypothetical protein [Fibrobacterota bacterium]
MSDNGISLEKFNEVRRAMELSRMINPQSEGWGSVAIWWGSNLGPEEIKTRMPLPFVQFATKDIFVANHSLTDYNVRNKQDGEKSEALSYLDNYGRVGQFIDGIFKETINYQKLTPVGEDFASFEHEYSAEVSKSYRDPKGIVTDELTQWVCFEVLITDSQPLEPEVELWAFLQPRGFDGETPIQQKADDELVVENNPKQHRESKDLELSQEDYPRSGWAQYRIHTLDGQIYRYCFDNGNLLDEEKVPNTDYAIFRMEDKKGKYVGCRVKLKVRIRNECTLSDMKRKKERIETALKALRKKFPDKTFTEKDLPDNPMNSIEAGCWLKVWVRNKNLDWDCDPSREESNECRKKMARLDATVETKAQEGEAVIRVHRKFPYHNHGFLRGRIVNGNSIAGVPEKPEKVVPLYVALIDSHAIQYLAAVIRRLSYPTKVDKPVIGYVGSMVAAGLSTALLSVILRSAMKTYISKASKRPPGGFDETEAEEESIKERIYSFADFIENMLKLFTIPELIAAFGLSSFDCYSYYELMANAKSTPDAHKMLSNLISQVLKLSINSSPKMMERNFRKGQEARKKALDQKVSESNGDVDRKSIWETLKKMISDGAVGGTRTKGAIDGEVIDLAITIARISSKKRFPRPFGEPIMTPAGGPIGFVALLVQWQAQLDAVFNCTLKSGMLDLSLGLLVPKGTSIRVGLEARPIFSVLADQGYPGLNAELVGNPKQASEKIGKRLEDKSPPTDKELDEMEIMQLMRMLQSCLDCSIDISLGLEGDGYVGVRYQYDTVNDKSVFALSDSTKNALGMTAKTNVLIGIRLFCINWVFAPLEAEFFHLSQEEVNFCLKGKCMGESFDKGSIYKHKLIAEFDKYLSFHDSRGVALGGPILSSTYHESARMDAIEGHICWGYSRVVGITFSNVSIAPPATLNYMYAEGRDTEFHEQCDPDSDPFFSKSYSPATPQLMREIRTENDVPYRWESDLELKCETLGAEINKVISGLNTPIYNAPIRDFVCSVLRYKYTPFIPSMDVSRTSKKLKQHQIIVLRPELKKIRIEFHQDPTGSKFLKADLSIDNFVDKSLWARIQIEVFGFNDFVLVNDQQWQLLAISKTTSYEKNSTGQVFFPLDSVRLPKGKEIWMEIALIPHSDGIIDPDQCEKSKIKVT